MNMLLIVHLKVFIISVYNDVFVCVLYSRVYSYWFPHTNHANENHINHISATSETNTFGLGCQNKMINFLQYIVDAFFVVVE